MDESGVRRASAVDLAQALAAIAPQAPVAEDRPPPLLAFDRRITDEGLRAVARPRFASGHYADSVEAGVKFLIESVKTKAGRDGDADGTGLMTSTFSVDRPVLRVNRLKSRSNRSEQLGYMHLMAGVCAAFRNPRAHSASVEDSPETALMMLELTDHLVETVRKSTRTRRSRA